MLLNELLKGCCTLCDYDGNTAVTGVSCDSRAVTRGNAFIALKGEKSDGNDYINDACKRGALCVVTEKRLTGVKIPVITVKNSRSTCAVMYSNLYGRPADNMNTVAVTGTNGKTTVASLLWHIYAGDGRRTGLVGTVTKRGLEKELEGERWDNMTTPTPDKLYKYIYEMKRDGCRELILEASSHGLSASRLDGMHIDAGAFTNLTAEHLDYHGSMENYYKSKCRLCELSETFLVNYDDPYGKRMCEEYPRALAFSAIPETAADSRVWATAAMYRSKGLSGIEYMFCCKDTVFPIKSRMVGKNALYNTLTAAAVALKQGVSPKSIAKGIGSFGGVKGRFEIVCTGRGVPTCIIDYAHTPDSFEKVLIQTRALMKHGSKLLLVFGCGGERDRRKRSVMGRIAEKYADTVIVTEDNPRGEEIQAITKEIISGMKHPSDAVILDDREEALHYAVKSSRACDVIVVLGKGHEEYIIDKCGKRPFYERTIIKNSVLERYGIPSEEQSVEKKK